MTHNCHRLSAWNSLQQTIKLPGKKQTQILTSPIQKKDTLHKTNIAPENYFPLGARPIFRGYVSFGEGKFSQIRK